MMYIKFQIKYAKQIEGKCSCAQAYKMSERWQKDGAMGDWNTDISLTKDIRILKHSYNKASNVKHMCLR